MARKLRRKRGQALYPRRKAIVEPVIGLIKRVRGFRQFLLRGLAKVRAEWALICTGHNLLKLFRSGWAAARGGSSGRTQAGGSPRPESDCDRIHSASHRPRCRSSVTRVRIRQTDSPLRLIVLTYYLVTALKRLALLGDFVTARPKRLRFLLFNAVGKVLHHAPRTPLRLTGAIQLALMVAVRQRIAALAPA